MAPWEVESLIDRFIDHYNNERLHQSINYVTPAERHDGRHTAIIAARKRGMQEAKRQRRMEANGGVRDDRRLREFQHAFRSKGLAQSTLK